MVSDWLNLMLEEIARRREERQRAREESQRRRDAAATEPSTAGQVGDTDGTGHPT